MFILYSSTYGGAKQTIINLRRMHEGYSSHSVCVCVSVTKLAATYLLVYTLKVGCN